MDFDTYICITLTKVAPSCKYAVWSRMAHLKEIENLQLSLVMINYSFEKKLIGVTCVLSKCEIIGQKISGS